MDAFIKELHEQRQAAADKVKNLDIAIKAVQEACEHLKWHPAGHDSHYNYEVCDRCGKEEKV